MTAIFSELNLNKLQFNVKNEMTLIFVKFGADFINSSKVKIVKKTVFAFWPTL